MWVHNSLTPNENYNKMIGLNQVKELRDATVNFHNATECGD